MKAISIRNENLLTPWDGLLLGCAPHSHPWGPGAPTRDSSALSSTKDPERLAAAWGSHQGLVQIHRSNGCFIWKIPWIKWIKMDDLGW